MRKRSYSEEVNPEKAMKIMLDHNKYEMRKFKVASLKNLRKEFKDYIKKYQNSPIQAQSLQKSRKKEKKQKSSEQ